MDAVHWSDPSCLLDAVERVLAASRPEVLHRFSAETRDLVPHLAAVMRTGDCARFPMKVSGDAGITGAVTSAEVAALADRCEPGTPVVVEGVLGGESRHLLLTTSAPAVGSGALLVLVLPDSTPDDASVRMLGRLWDLLSLADAQRATDTEPELLAGNLAATAARAQAIADLQQTQATALAGLLSVLRSGRLSDAAARRTATELATRALLDVRSAAARDQQVSTETAVEAFAAFTEHVEPLARHGQARIELAGPAESAVLPQDVALAARTVSRGLLLSALDGQASRVRVAWSVTGGVLSITVRDDDPDPAAPAVDGVRERVAALGGTIDRDATPGWGTTVAVSFPLDVPAPPSAQPLDRLHPRELEVLAGLARGLRNRQIAQELHLSEHTVKFHVRKILEKLGVASRGEAAALARQYQPTRGTA